MALEDLHARAGVDIDRVAQIKGLLGLAMWRTGCTFAPRSSDPASTSSAWPHPLTLCHSGAMVFCAMGNF